MSYVAVADGLAVHSSDPEWGRGEVDGGPQPPGGLVKPDSTRAEIELGLVSIFQ